MKSFYKQFLATAENASIPVLSDEYCCELLAWLQVFGGGNEAVTHNEKLIIHWRIAQKRLNIFAGERPNSNLINLYKAKWKELEPYTKPTPYRNRSKFKCPVSIDWQNKEYYPDWCNSIFKKYKLIPPEPI